MVDEIKVIKILGNNGRELELKADFNAFKNLNKATGNGFATVETFANDESSRLDLLPIFIQAMSSEKLTIQEIESEFLGLSYVKVAQMSNLIFSLIFEELVSEVKTETETKNVATPVTKSKKTRKTGDK